MISELPEAIESWRDEFPVVAGARVHRAAIVSGGAVTLYEFTGCARAAAYFDSVPDAVAAVATGQLALRQRRDPAPVQRTPDSHFWLHEE